MAAMLDIQNMQIVVVESDGFSHPETMAGGTQTIQEEIQASHPSIELFSLACVDTLASAFLRSCPLVFGTFVILHVELVDDKVLDGAEGIVLVILDMLLEGAVVIVH